MEYLFGGCADASWYSRDVGCNECRKFYKEICKEHKEIRVHLLRGDRIGECMPVYLMAAQETKENALKGILDIFVLCNPRNFNNRLMEIMSRNTIL